MRKYLRESFDETVWYMGCFEAPWQAVPLWLMIVGGIAGAYTAAAALPCVVAWKVLQWWSVA